MPAELVSMAGVKEFYDPHEPLPVWCRPEDVASYRACGAWSRWNQARHDWCDVNGVDFAETFYPHWKEWR